MIDALNTPWVLYTAISLLGLVIGSFLNVVIFRLPKMMDLAWRRDCCEFLDQPAPDEQDLSLVFPNSCCPNCGTAIKPWHNIPIVSFIALGGHCSTCKAAISLRYPAIELLTALLSLLSAIVFGPTLELLLALPLVWSLITLSFIDIDTQLLPDVVTMPLLWFGLLVNLNGVFATPENAIIGAVAGYLTLWSVYWAFKLIMGKEGMGYGDFKLLAALGAWFGWQALPLIIIMSSFLGALIGVAIIAIRGQDRDLPIPFGPYLAGAGLTQLFFGEPLMSAYMALVT